MDVLELIRQGKIKRYFRARRKLSFPGLISHITQRAAGKGLLFVEDADYLYMLKLLKELKEDYDLTFLAFCLLQNHVHILIKQLQENLSESMHNLFTRYAIYFNNKYNRIGHLFCGPFRQAACFDDYYLLAASIYIHMNPVRAGIVRHYSSYRWSSWQLYCQPRQPDSFVDYNFILRMLNEDITRAKNKYINLLDKSGGYKAGEITEDTKVIGKFSTWLHKNFPGVFENKQAIQEEKILAEGYTCDKALDEAVERLKGKRRLTEPGDIRAREYAVLQLKSRGFSAREIADYLDSSYPTVYAVLAKQKNQNPYLTNNALP
ncbi:MAG: transposase [PVC group bacterium]